MKYSDINKKFTEIVSGYIARGYTINTQSMGGSQGEVCRMDLTLGDELIRVWISDVSNTWSPGDWNGYIVRIHVGKWKLLSKMSGECIVWYRDIDIINEYTYYVIDRNNWYVESLEEALELQEKRKKRFYNNLYSPQSKTYTDDAHKDIAARYLRRKHGYKRISRDKISVVKGNTPTYDKFTIHYNHSVFHIN